MFVKYLIPYFKRGKFRFFDPCARPIESLDAMVSHYYNIYEIDIGSIKKEITKEKVGYIVMQKRFFLDLEEASRENDAKIELVTMVDGIAIYKISIE